MIKLVSMLLICLWIAGCNQEGSDSSNSGNTVVAQDPRFAWVVEPWSNCSINDAEACSGTGFQNRQVFCKKDPGGTVSDSFCLEKIGANSKPLIEKECKSIAGQLQSNITFAGLTVGSVTRSCREGENLPFQSTGYCNTGFKYLSSNFTCTPEELTFSTSSISPISPSNSQQNAPLVKAKTSSLVNKISFYSDSICQLQNPIVNSTNVLNLFNSSGINIQLTPNVKQDIYLKLESSTYSLSKCVLFIKDYVHDNRVPNLSITARDNYINSNNSSSYNLKGICKDNFNINFIKSLSNSILKTQACNEGVFDVNLDFSNKFNFPDGIVQIKLSQTDSANNIGEISLNINKDTETSVSLTNFQSLVNLNNQQAFSISGTCDSGVIDFSVNSISLGSASCVNGAFATATNLTPASEGNIDLGYKITDIAGNTLQKNVSLVKDSIPPNLTISPMYGYINADNKDSPYVVSGSCESAAGATNVKILRAETNQEIFNDNCVNNFFTYSFDFSTALDQIYQYKVIQTDGSGNEKIVLFGVNKSSNKPSIYITATPNYANIANKIVQFKGECSVQGPIQITAGAKNFSTSCQLNSSTYKFEFEYSIDFSDYLDQTIAVNFSISDGINIENKIVSILKDTISPTFTISNTNLYTNSSSFAISGICSEEGQPIKITDPLDNEFTTTCLAGEFQTVVSLNNLPQGTILLNIQHTDLAQNVSTQVIPLIKDITPPSNSSISYPLYTKNTFLPITINYQDSSPISKILIYENETCSGNAQRMNYSNNSGMVYNYAHNISGSQNKYSRFISVKIEDSAGNQTDCLNYNDGKYTYVNKLDNPVLISINPESPSSHVNIFIKGTVDEISNSVGLYSNNLCSNSLFVGSKNNFSGVSGQQIVVSENVRTEIFAKSFNSDYNLESDCVLLGDYINDSNPPQLSAVPASLYINNLNQSKFLITGSCEKNSMVFIKDLTDQIVKNFICDSSESFSQELDFSNSSSFPENSNVFLKFEQIDDAQNTASVLINLFKDTYILMTDLNFPELYVNLLNQNSFVISGKCSDGTIKVYESNNLVSQSNCPGVNAVFSNTFNLSSIPDKMLNLKIVLEDAAGNSQSFDHQILKDTILPTVSHTSNYQYINNDNNIVFSGECSEIGNKIDIINLYNNQHSTPDLPEFEDVNLCDETGHYSVSVANPNPESVMYFKIVHKDNAQNEASLTVSIIKDKTPPSISATSHPQYIVGATLPVSISYTETLSGIDKILIYSSANCSGAVSQISYNLASNSVFNYSHGIVTSETQDGFFSYRLVDKAGNQSISCGVNTATSGKFTVINKLPDPQLTSISPDSPSSVSSPLLIGTVGNLADTISFYSDSNCGNLITQNSSSLFTSTGQNVSVSLNSQTSIYAKTSLSSAAVMSNCKLLTSYTHDNIAPAITSISHPKYTSSNLPVTINYTENNGVSKVRAYSSIDCSGTYVDSNFSASSGSVFNFSHGKITSSIISGLFSMKLIDTAGNVSTCVTNNSTSGEYIYVNSLPSPILASSSPSSPSTSTTVTLKGSVNNEATDIAFYSNPSCSTLLNNYVSKNAFTGSSGQNVSVPQNSYTSIYSKVKIAGTSFESDCVFLTSFINDLAPPVITSITIPNITSSSSIPFTIYVSDQSYLKNIYIYENGNCSGAPITISINASVSAVSSAYYNFSMINKTNYLISFKADDSLDNISGCSNPYSIRYVNSLSAPSGFLKTDLNLSTNILNVQPGTINMDSDAESIQFYRDSVCSTNLGSSLTASQLSAGFSASVSSEFSIYAKVSNSSLGLDSSCSAAVGYSAVYPSLTNGYASFCGISNSNAIAYCWGLNSNGQLGFGNKINSNLSTLQSVKDSSLTPLSFLNISMGKYHACGITVAGNTVCWGKNDKGQLGNGANGADSTTAVSVTGNFKKVYAGDDFSCGITSDDLVKCWGDNSYGQLGIGTTDSTIRSSPVLINDSTKYKSLSLAIGGNAHACGITNTNALKCWGANYNYQIGISSGSTSSPVLVSDSDSYSKVTAGWGFTCGLLTNGTVKCWGSNTSGELGYGSASLPTSTKQNVAGTFKEIEAGGNTVCGITFSDTVLCWGDNTSSQIGQGSAGLSNNYYASPTLVSGLSSIKDIKLGMSAVCAQKSSGEVTCWGDNSEGSLGDGSNTPKTQPTTEIFFNVKAGP